MTQSLLEPAEFPVLDLPRLDTFQTNRLMLTAWTVPPRLDRSSGRSDRSRQRQEPNCPQGVGPEHGARADDDHAIEDCAGLRIDGKSFDKLARWRTDLRLARRRGAPYERGELPATTIRQDSQPTLFEHWWRRHGAPRAPAPLDHERIPARGLHAHSGCGSVASQ
jgi:hypothetical protein